MIETFVLYSSLYLALGAMIGQLHLLRCRSCAERFGTWAHHAKYIAASAMVAVPMTVLGFVQYWLADCDQ